MQNNVPRDYFYDDFTIGTCHTINRCITNLLVVVFYHWRIGAIGVSKAFIVGSYI